MFYLLCPCELLCCFNIKTDFLFYFIFLVVELVEELVNFRNILAFSECFFRNIDLTNDREWKVNLLHLYEIIKKVILLQVYFACCCL